MKQKRLKYFLFTSMMALIFLPMWFVPFLQQQYPNLQVERIVGYFGETKKPNIYGKRWMSGQFQQAYNAYVKNKKSSGHAIVAYMYPTGQNKLWTYDSWGSYRVRAYKDDPLDIAKKAVEARQEDRFVTSASFH